MTAKEYLLQYQHIQREIEDIDRRMAQVRLKYAAPSAINYSDMPKAHNSNHDLSDYVAKMDELTDYKAAFGFSPVARSLRPKRVR